MNEDDISPVLKNNADHKFKRATKEHPAAIADAVNILDDFFDFACADAKDLGMVLKYAGVDEEFQEHLLQEYRARRQEVRVALDFLRASVS
jgi:hypothetical protein